MTPPQSGGLDGGEQPQGLPDARAPQLFEVTIFIPALDTELLLVAVRTAHVLFFTSPRGDRIPSRPEGSPLSWRCRPPHCRAPAIADFPWREPTTAATASVPGLPDVHHTKSKGQALRVSLVKPGAYLSASYTSTAWQKKESLLCET